MLLFPIKSTLELLLWKRHSVQCKGRAKNNCHSPCGEHISCSKEQKAKKKHHRQECSLQLVRKEKPWGKLTFSSVLGAVTFNSSLVKCLPFTVNGWRATIKHQVGALAELARAQWGWFGLIWVDGEKLKAKKDASDGLKQVFGLLSELGRALLFPQPHGYL